MSRLRAAVWRLRALVRRRQIDDEIDDEIRSHLEEATQEYIQQGLSARQARVEALRCFGGVARTKEVYRDVSSFMWLEGLASDIRQALRGLGHNPAFTAATVSTLALAISANVAMFVVVDTVLLRPLPFRSPDQLAMLWSDDPTSNLHEGRSTLADVAEWRRRTQSFADIGTFDAMTTIGSGSGSASPAERIAGASFSSNLLSLIGVEPLRGRSVSHEEAEQRQPVVMISHRLWRARFGGSDEALRGSIVLDGRTCRIVGILPAGFQLAGIDADVWQAHPGSEQPSGPATWFVMGRLRPGVTFEQAQAEMSALSRHLGATLPETERTRGISVVPLRLQMVGRQSRVALGMLAGAVFCVLLIAAANVTSLALTRSTARHREIALRAAMGATSGRLVRQFLTESALLAFISAGIGLPLAAVSLRLIRTFGPADVPRLNEVGLDLRALAGALVISVIVGVLVGLAPAWHARRRDLRAVFDEGGRTVTGSRASRSVRRALVITEFALAIVLLTGAGLLVRSWWNVTRVDPGFEPARVLVMELSSPTSFDTQAQRADLYDRVLEQLQAVPGVENAGIIGDLFIGNSREQIVTVDGGTTMVSERLQLGRDEVSADFFTTLGTPLLQGRAFSTADSADAPAVAIINEAMARRVWHGREAVGRRFTLGAPEAGGRWYTVVGVVANLRRQGLEREALPQVFEPIAQNAPHSVDLFVRTSSDEPARMAGVLQAAVRLVEPRAPVYGIAPLDQQFGAYLAQRRFQTAILTAFAVVALLMAVVGIYGVMQYSVAIRRQEIGLRMAIGARGQDILRMTLGEGVRLSVIGLTLGLIGAWWLTRAVSSLLFGVAPTDPLTFAAVAVLLSGAATAACYIPARRAVAVEPAVALRGM